MSDSVGTPQWLFCAAVNLYGYFELDVCADKSNAKAEEYYTEKDNGLLKRWYALNWCNPPYSDPLPWVKKAIEETDYGCSTVLLLPADLSTEYAKLSFDYWVDILGQRIKFDGHTGSPKFGSMFVYISPQGFKGVRYFDKETIKGWKK